MAAGAAVLTGLFVIGGLLQIAEAVLGNPEEPVVNHLERLRHEAQQSALTSIQGQQLYEERIDKMSALNPLEFQEGVGRMMSPMTVPPGYEEENPGILDYVSNHLGVDPEELRARLSPERTPGPMNLSNKALGGF